MAPINNTVPVPASADDTASIWKSRKTRKAVAGMLMAFVGVLATLASQKFGLSEDQATKLSFGVLTLVGYLIGQDIRGTALEDAAAKGVPTPPFPPGSGS